MAGSTEGGISKGPFGDGVSRGEPGVPPLTEAVGNPGGNGSILAGEDLSDRLSSKIGLSSLCVCLGGETDRGRLLGYNEGTGSGKDLLRFSGSS